MDKSPIKYAPLLLCIVTAPVFFIISYYSEARSMGGSTTSDINEEIGFQME